jgi:hypothetical protein
MPSSALRAPCRRRWRSLAAAARSASGLISSAHRALQVEHGRPVEVDAGEHRGVGAGRCGRPGLGGRGSPREREAHGQQGDEETADGPHR